MKEDRGPISPPGPEESTYLLARRAAMWANDHMLNAGYDIDGQFARLNHLPASGNRQSSWTPKVQEEFA